MRIGKPLLIGCTLVGAASGLYEGYRLVGGLVVLMAAMLALIGTGVAIIVGIIRRERAEEERAALERASGAGSGASPPHTHTK